MQQDNEAPASRPGLDKRTSWLRCIFAGMEDALLLTDAGGRITFLNPAAEALCGWSLAQVRGDALNARLQLLSAETRGPIDPTLEQVLREGQSVEFTEPTLLLGKEGRERPIAGTIIPLHNKGEQLSGLVFLLRDVSERQGAERAVEEGIHYGETILATLGDPFLVLDRQLRVKSATARSMKPSASRAPTPSSVYCMNWARGSGKLRSCIPYYKSSSTRVEPSTASRSNMGLAHSVSAACCLVGGAFIGLAITLT